MWKILGFDTVSVLQEYKLHAFMIDGNVKRFLCIVQNLLRFCVDISSINRQGGSLIFPTNRFRYSWQKYFSCGLYSCRARTAHQRTRSPPPPALQYGWNKPMWNWLSDRCLFRLPTTLLKKYIAKITAKTVNAVSKRIGVMLKHRNSNIMK